MTNPWQLYDDLIDALPADVRVTGCLVSHFSCIATDAGVGVAMVDEGGPRASWPERRWSDATSGRSPPSPSPGIWNWPASGGGHELVVQHRVPGEAAPAR